MPTHNPPHVSLILPRTGSWLPPAAPVLADSPPETSRLPPESAYFPAVNRNKRSITVNFKQPDGRAIVERLVRRSDVLVENFVPGKLASLGLGYEDCRRMNERLIYASISGAFKVLTSYWKFDVELKHPELPGYGQTGLHRQAARYDVVVEGEAGLMHMYVRTPACSSIALTTCHNPVLPRTGQPDRPQCKVVERFKKQFEEIASQLRRELDDIEFRLIG